MSKKFEDRYYRIDEVAGVLAVHERTVRRMIHDPLSELPAIRVNRSLRVHGRDLNAYVQDNEIDAAEAYGE